MHLKDFTIINLQPKNAVLKMSNFVLKANCDPPKSSTSTTSKANASASSKINSSSGADHFGISMALYCLIFALPIFMTSF